MKPIYLRFTAAVALSAAIAACVASPPAPSPAPTPTPSPSPTMTSTPVVQSYSNWLDAPQTPGDWSYRQDASGSMASFGEDNSGARFALRCFATTREIGIMRAGVAQRELVMRIRTETGDRTLTVSPAGNALPMVETRVAARDPMFDAMAITKGRFAVEVENMPALYIPSWTEVSRVIEDCR